ncbi:MAG: nuclease-related domain-containing protein [Janthinobacterium lividum]
MPQIEIFHGAPVDNKAEIHVLRHIRQWLERTGQAAIIFANVKLARQLDLVVFIEQAAIVVEVKSWLGRVDGGKNGSWVRTMPGGEPEYLHNGFDQVLNGNYALRDAFRDISIPAKSYPYGIVVFKNGLDAGSTVEEECDDYRVRVCRMNDLETALDNARGQAWAFDDVRALAESLRLVQENDPPSAPRSRRASIAGAGATGAAGAAVRATPRAAPREIARSTAAEPHPGREAFASASRVTPTQTARHPQPSARTRKARKTPILLTLGIVGVLAAVGIGISHKSGRTPGTTAMPAWPRRAENRFDKHPVTASNALRGANAAHGMRAASPMAQSHYSDRRPAP